MAQMAIAEANRKNALENPKYQIFKRLYYYDWAGFAQNCIKWQNDTIADYQLEMLAQWNSGCLFDWRQKPSLEEVLALPMSAFGHQKTERYSIRGPHGLGKTMMAALLILGFALTSDGITDWKIITTASRYQQLKRYLWPEVDKWARRIDWNLVGRPMFTNRELLQMELTLSTGEGFAASPQRAEEMEGGHASRMMYVFDESKIIKKAFFDAAEGAFSTAGEDTEDEGYQLAISTPGEPVGVFYNIHARKKEYINWTPRHVTVDEAIASGRISREWLENAKRLWKPYPAMLANRAYGEFAVSSEKTVIPLAWIEAAINRWYAWEEEIKNDQSALGILTSVGGDVSEGNAGSDANAIAPIYDWVKVARIETLPNGEYDDAVIEMGTRIGEIMLGGQNKNAQAIIDAVGVGVGSLHWLRSSGFWARAFKSGYATKLVDQTQSLGFVNWRCAAWWLTREMLDPKNGMGVCLPPTDDDRLIMELSTPKWKRTPQMQIWIESKDETKKRIGVSPDYADAVMMGLIGPTLCDEFDAGKEHYEYGMI